MWPPHTVWVLSLSLLSWTDSLLLSLHPHLGGLCQTFSMSAPVSNHLKTEIQTFIYMHSWSKSLTRDTRSTPTDSWTNLWHWHQRHRQSRQMFTNKNCFILPVPFSGLHCVVLCSGEKGVFSSLTRDHMVFWLMCLPLNPNVDYSNSRMI